ncbi:MAG: DUF1223 domain-containing protein [Alphaproteobacteria bacterium]|nr:DUF1223 domain-containing protein [Alphaproteobacteria bacterium]
MKSWLTCLIATIFLVCNPAGAQEANPTGEEAISGPGKTSAPDISEIAASHGPVVVELFSSQACVFCPAADRFFADLVRSPDLIGLACHVNYFDVRDGSLARDFCSERQSDYMTLLRAGPNYTPQIVVNGMVEAVGYRHEGISAALREGSGFPVLPLVIQKGAEPGTLLVSFPSAFAVPASSEQKSPPATEFTLWLARYDNTHDVTIAEGSHRGKQMTYANIVSELEPLEPWDGVERHRTFSSGLRARHKGLAVLVQDPKTGRIVAAGKYERRGPPNPLTVKN